VKITFIGPGKMEIPPRGWGAVEALIWDYKGILGELGHTVTIVNTEDQDKIVQQVKASQPDFVHLHYDEYVEVVKNWDYPTAITTHYGYLPNLSRLSVYYWRGFRKLLQTNAYIFALSSDIRKIFMKNGFDEEKIFVVPNGVCVNRFRFTLKPKHADKTICLAKIEPRKRQNLLQEIESVDFAGRVATRNFPKDHPNYLGEWLKERVFQDLTDYANLALLSRGEAHSLAVLEALAAGLGIVVSEHATAHLDPERPFIDVIPEDRVSNKNLVESVIKRNRKTSLKMRPAIRRYAQENFDWEKIIQQKYLPLIQQLT